MEFPYSVDKHSTVFLSVSGPLKWINKEKTMIECTVDIYPLGVVKYGASKFDDEVQGRDLYDHLMTGVEGPIADYERRDVYAFDLQEELNKIMPDILLGTATPDQIELAKALRIQIKAMS
ncbi:MAG: hypothetical protein ACOH2R_17350 [Pseudomonas sp.]